MATMVSGCIYLGTMMWYRSSQKDSQSQSQDAPIAQVEKTFEDVRRKPVDRQMWFPVSAGDTLFPGESIRTSSSSSIGIYFLSSGRNLDIEPDSLVVINQGSNSIDIDLKTGGLFIDQGTEGIAKDGEPSFTVRSKSGQINLSRATASISTTANNDIEVQVLNGQAEVTSQGQTKLIQGKVQLQENGQHKTKSEIEILGPRSDQPFYLNPEIPQQIIFAWKGAPKGHPVQLLLGSQRKNLKPVAKVESEQQDSLRLSLRPGKYFWKLQAVDPSSTSTSLESAVARLDVQALYPPAPISPEEEKQEKTGTTVQFQWQTPKDAKQVVLEIAKESNLKSKLIHKSLLPGEQKFQQQLPDGKYYWRLSSIYQQTPRAFSTPVMSFHIGTDSQLPRVPATQAAPVTPAAPAGNQPASNQPAALPPTSQQKALRELKPEPAMESPRFLPPNGQLEATAQGLLDLRWTRVPKATSYEVSIRNKDGSLLFQKKFKGNSGQVANMMPGEYTAEIISSDEKGRESQPHSPREVLVPDNSGLEAPKLKKVKVRE